MQKSAVSYFYGAGLVALVTLSCAFFLGGVNAMWIVGVLAVLETSLSFDNAVVNASVLKDMTPQWRKRFITFGMPIAVLGMRLLFPMVIVSIVAALNPVDTFRLALDEPRKYADILQSAHHQIVAFGGAFLLMLFFKYFIDEEKEVHWIAAIEAPLARIGKLDMIQVAGTLAVLCIVSTFLTAGQASFLAAGAWGIVTYIGAESLGEILGSEDAAGQVVRQGLAGLLYLELIDASFSFDGVMGAFALSTNIFVIMAGLGVGAMFVRSLTLMLVDKGTLAEYRYLEHGAFYAIGALAALMFVGLFQDVPETVTGLLGAGLIVLAFISSLKANKAEAAESDTALSTNETTGANA